MSNQEIIANEAIEKQIFTREQIDKFIEDGDIPLKTENAWKNSGYVLKANQEPKMKVKLWLSRGGSGYSYCLVPAYLYTREQVVELQ